MKTITCDRCGEYYYEQKELPGEIPILKPRRIEMLLRDTNISYPVNLCYACYEQLRQWFLYPNSTIFLQVKPLENEEGK